MRAKRGVHRFGMQENLILQLKLFLIERKFEKALDFYEKRSYN